MEPCSPVSKVVALKSQSFTCARKIRFATQQEAEKQRFAHEEQRHVDKGELKTYRCRRCGGFHNGHLEPRSRKAEREYVAEVTYYGRGLRVSFTIGDRLIEQWRQMK